MMFKIHLHVKLKLQFTKFNNNNARAIYLKTRNYAAATFLILAHLIWLESLQLSANYSRYEIISKFNFEMTLWASLSLCLQALLPCLRHTQEHTRPEISILGKIRAR